MCTVPVLEVTSIIELQPVKAAAAASNSSGETTVFTVAVCRTKVASKL
jgi:hypothetical protein